MSSEALHEEQSGVLSFEPTVLKLAAGVSEAKAFLAEAQKRYDDSVAKLQPVIEDAMYSEEYPSGTFMAWVAELPEADRQGVIAGFPFGN